MKNYRPPRLSVCDTYPNFFKIFSVFKKMLASSNHSRCKVQPSCCFVLFFISVSTVCLSVFVFFIFIWFGSFAIHRVNTFLMMTFQKPSCQKHWFVLFGLFFVIYFVCISTSSFNNKNREWRIHVSVFFLPFVEQHLFFSF